MGDLQKFVRQHLFDNHWTRDADLATLNEERLSSIDSSFAHIDVRSKLCLLLSFSNLGVVSEQVAKHIESIFLQALDEENNLVKAVATVLHCKQSLNYLNFDISPTNEAFRKNLEKLLKSVNSWNLSETPLLAECLSPDVLTSLSSPEYLKKSSSGSSRVTRTRKLGFKCRCRPPSVTQKDAYLERLKDECQRRRVHVPIPGRSFTRLEENEDSTADNADNAGFISNPTPASRRLTPLDHNNTNKKPWHRPPPYEDHLKPNSDLLDRPGESLRSSGLARKLIDRTPIPAQNRKPSGIKLLEFDELPAFGPKAKQLRKEQLEKERKLKRREREERLKEQKAAREAAKLARTTEKNSSLITRLQPDWPDGSVSDLAPHSTPGGILPRLPTDQIRPQFPVNSGTSITHQPIRSNPGVLINRHPLLTLPASVSAVQEIMDDDDDEDDDGELLLPPETNYTQPFSSDYRPQPSNGTNFMVNASATGIPPSVLIKPSLVSTNVQPRPNLEGAPIRTSLVDVQPRVQIRLVQSTQPLSATQTSAASGANIRLISSNPNPPAIRLLPATTQVVNHGSLVSCQNTVSRQSMVVSQSNSSFVNIMPGPPARPSISSNMSTISQAPTFITPQHPARVVAPSITVLQPQATVPSTTVPVTIVPRSPHLIRLQPSSTTFSGQPELRPRLVHSSVTPTQSQTTYILSPQAIRPQGQTVLQSANGTWSLDTGGQIILAPVGIANTQVSSTKPSVQGTFPPGFIQLVQRPAAGGGTAFVPATQQSSFHVIQPNPGASLADVSNPILLPSVTSSTSQGTNNTVSLTPVATPPVVSSTPTSISVDPMASGVKIQDDLCLTEAQLNSVQSLFQGANRVSRPEKAMIVSFIAGARGHPRPETGNTLRIRLSEYRERVLNQASGQLMDVAADTYLVMDYATGTCEKVKYYRTESPEILRRLPMQPASQ